MFGGKEIVKAMDWVRDDGTTYSESEREQKQVISQFMTDVTPVHLPGWQSSGLLVDDWVHVIWKAHISLQEI